MDFKLWKNASPDNSINKSLSGGTTINIFLKRDVDVSNPEIILKTVSGVDFGAFARRLGGKEATARWYEIPL